MNLSERDYTLGFSVFPDIGPARFELLLQYFGSAKNIWNAKDADLFSTKLPGKIATNFISFRNRFDFDKFKLELAKKNIRFLNWGDKDFPKLLKQIASPPIVLYLRGNPEILNEKILQVAIVGTRNMTDYGKEATEKIVKELVSKRVCIISGLAAGIDTIAHSTALQNKGKTIAVLGSGIDRIYPPANYDLYWRIIRSGGLIVSEYPPGFAPTKTTFPLRNRIIAGLSNTVVVIEGKKTSGALITAKYALDAGREVFAVPGPINSSMSEGTSYLIKNGANIATSAEDIMVALND